MEFVNMAKDARVTGQLENSSPKAPKAGSSLPQGPTKDNTLDSILAEHGLDDNIWESYSTEFEGAKNYKTLKAALEDYVIRQRIDELKNIVIVMSGIPVSEQGHYLIADVERRTAELKAHLKDKEK